MSKVVRFIEYRRAAWFNDGNVLESHFRDFWGRCPKAENRIFVRSDDTAYIANSISDLGGDGIFFQLARYVDGQPIGIIPMIDLPNIALDERRPGNAENYLESAVFVLIKDDHVLSINAGQNAAVARNYLHGVFQNAGLDDEASRFDLVRIARADKIRKIHAAGGVDKIQLDLSIEEATAAYLDEEAQRMTTNGLSSAVSKIIGYVMHTDHEASKISTSSKGKVRMTLGVPASDRLTAKEGLDAIAQVLVEEEDSDTYVIKLRNGDTIKPSEISAKKRVRIEKYANTLDSAEVISEFKEYLSELRRSGQMEI